MSLRVFSVFLLFLLLSPSRVLALNILCLGDSLTEGYGVEKNQAWPAVTESILRQKKINVTLINVGISGSTTASAQARLKWHLKSKVKFDWMILALGANDGLRGQPVKGIRNNLEKTVEFARASGIKKIILAGIKVPTNYGKKYTADFAAMYPSLAKALKLPLVPFLLEGVAAKPDLNLPDGIHPNVKGHEIIAKTMANFIEKQL
jgi:acyl-CoA thioesterase I